MEEEVSEVPVGGWAEWLARVRPGSADAELHDVLLQAVMEDSAEHLDGATDDVIRAYVESGIGLLMVPRGIGGGLAFAKFTKVSDADDGDGLVLEAVVFSPAFKGEYVAEYRSGPGRDGRRKWRPERVWTA